MRRGAALLAAGLATAPGAASVEAAAAGAAEPALCTASVSLDPPRAVPGQQVVYRLRLLVREDVDDASFEEPPSFPGLRAERLATAPAGGPVLHGGAPYHVRDDARALFADRPGSIAIPPARLVCRARGPGGEVAERVATPAAALEVVPLPEAGRPAAFSGLVGPLSLHRHLTPESVALGRSVRLALTLQGSGNLWDAPPPALLAEALGGAEVFLRSADVELDRGAHLGVRRRFVFDLVARREGALEIPAIAFAYYDPVAGRYGEVAVRPVRVEVGPAVPVVPTDREEAAGADPVETQPGSAATRPGARSLLAAGAVLLAAALGASAWLARRRRGARAGPARAALARADAARAAGDRDGELAELARALRAALAAKEGAGAADLLAALERARFDPAAEAPAREAVLRCLAELGVVPAGRI